MKAPTLSPEAAARLERLYQAFNDRMVGLAYQRTRDFHLAQDIAQNAWIAVASSIDQLRGADADAWPWLAVIVRHCIADHYTPRSAGERPTDWSAIEEAPRLPASPSAERVALADPSPELPGRLRRALDRLTCTQRAALLARAEGRSWQAVGAYLGRQDTSVLRAARRGAEALRPLLADAVSPRYVEAAA